MATLQLTTDFSKTMILLKPCLTSLFVSTRRRHCTTSLPRLVPRASSSSLSRRHFVSETAALSLALTVPSFGSAQPAKSEEPALSEWEKVSLPIDPGVVLLDIAFVPDDPKHGKLEHLSSLNCLLLDLSSKFVGYWGRFSFGDSANPFGDQGWWTKLGSAFNSLS